MMRHSNPDFASDVFCLLEALGARLGVRAAGSAQTEVSAPAEWLGRSMEGKVLLFVAMPVLTAQHKFM